MYDDTTAPKRQYLVDYLAEEFSRDTSVRLRVMPVDGEEGVVVRTESREYFFPFAWADQGQFAEVVKLIHVIKQI